MFELYWALDFQFLNAVCVIFIFYLFFLSISFRAYSFVLFWILIIFIFYQYIKMLLHNFDVIIFF